MKAFKTFWNDYSEVLKITQEWYRKHWLGYIILIFIMIIPVFFIYTLDFWSEKIEHFRDKKKFHKKED